MVRVIEPEILDHLASNDPEAISSRDDLRRLNKLMGHAGLLTRTFHRYYNAVPLVSEPMRVADLGAGTGTLCLAWAHSLALKRAVDLVLVDRQDIVAETTKAEFERLGWTPRVCTLDVQTWLQNDLTTFDVMVANLFLHHFENETIRALFGLAAEKTRLFIACEPRRSLRGLSAAGLVRLIGCNRVTAHDATVSVRAGFAGKELSELWPTRAGWDIAENSASLFSHSFVAKRQ